MLPTKLLDDFLTAQGYTGHINEKLKKYLTAQGHSGALNDQLYKFLSSKYGTSSVPEGLYLWGNELIGGGGPSFDPATSVFTIDSSINTLGSIALDGTQTGVTTVDWGDGNILTAPNNGSLWQNTYSGVQEYTVTVSGPHTRVVTNQSDTDNVVRILNVSTSVNSLVRLGYGNSNLLSAPSTIPLGITNANSAFTISPQINADFGEWDLSSCTAMHFFLSGCSSFSGRLPWATLASCTNFFRILSGASSYTGAEITDNLNLSSGTNFSNAFDNSGLTPTAYGNLLKSLAASNLNTNVPLGAANVQYDASAQAAKDTLLARGWLITDGGVAP